MTSRLPADIKTNLAGLAGVFAYLYLISRTIGLRPDHAFLSLIVLVFLVYGRQWGKLFIIDWLPFILFWVAYDMMRGVADSIRGAINIAGPFHLEQSLFGWLTPAAVPAFYFQQFQVAWDGTLLRTVFDLLSALMYALHFVSPLILGWFFWYTLNERRAFYLCVYTFTALNVMALITFMVFPVAPPWYVFEHGFGQPTDVMLDSAGALVNFDRIVGRRFFVSFYNTFNSNLFAAIPSLHAGYPTVIAAVSVGSAARTRVAVPGLSAAGMVRGGISQPSLRHRPGHRVSLRRRRMGHREGRARTLRVRPVC